MDKIQVANSRYIHNLNQAGIFHLIHQYGPVSRKELAENTGYSAATVSNHVKKLMDKGFVIETEKGNSTGGRKPVYLTINPGAGYILSINIEVQQVRLVLFNLKLEIEINKIFPIAHNKKPAEIINRIIQETNQIIKEKGIKKEQVLGLGIAVPGLIDQNQRVLEFAPNLGWKQVDIVTAFQDNYPFAIILENEANAAVIGEKEYNYPNISNMVYISVNEGIGCGIIFNHELYRGASGNAGEFGHIIIDSGGSLCHCGNRGCWETLASEQYIVNEYQRLKKQKKTKEEIYLAGEGGDKEVVKIFKRVGHNIGVGLVNIVNSLSPELLVLGGGISRIKDYIYEEMEQVLAERALAISYNKVEVKISKLGDLAPIYGMAQLVFAKSLDLI